MALQVDAAMNTITHPGPLAQPDEARLAMPTQSLRVAPPQTLSHQTMRVHLARTVAFGGGTALTVFGAWQMSMVFGNVASTLAQTLLLVLFTITFGWIALAAMQTLAAAFAGKAPDPRDDTAPLTTRTAIIMPVYNENPAATCAALQAIAEGIVAHGEGHAFEIFILSDTTSPTVWVRETACYSALRSELSGQMRVWYRRRFDSSGRKAGNLRDFVERWGGRYHHMVVLDADSLMAPDTLINMARRMQAAPCLGILQTVPMLTGGRTVFARVQQFAGRVYGPVIARGVSAWQGTDGNYWGHNAIIRVRAFAQCCGLPKLPGPTPFGGYVLSHDFVEAALIRRGGWEVRMDTDLDGSWEGSPQTLLDLAARDRRWAQGNLQHAGIVGAKGLTWPNRAHFLIGIGSYVMSSIWLAMLVTGAFLTVQSLVYQTQYFGDGPQLFPNWPIFDAQRMMWLLGLSMALLFLPKIVGAARAIALPSVRRAFGGGWRILGGTVVEVILSALLAPILMLFQVRQVAEILSGRDSGWSSQSRDAAIMPWCEAFRRHGIQLLIGAAAFAAVLHYATDQLIWVAPVLLGLVLAPVLSRVTGQDIDTPLVGLLSIPEDRNPPAVALRAAELRTVYEATASPSPLDLLVDAPLRMNHLCTLSPEPMVKAGSRLNQITARAKLEEAKDPVQALEWLTKEELEALLASPEMLTWIDQAFARTSAN